MAINHKRLHQLSVQFAELRESMKIGEFDLCVFFIGLSFFVCLYFSVLTVVRHVFPLMHKEDLREISMRLVSSTHAALSVVTGLMIVKDCKKDLCLHYRSRHALTNPFLSVSLAYYYFDFFAMFVAFWDKRRRYRRMQLAAAFGRFLSKHPIMLIHHTIIPCVILPTLVAVRQDLGDFFIGLWFLMEMPEPFINIRSFMLHFKLEQHDFFLVNDGCVALAWLLFRVLVFPYGYVQYGRYRGLSVNDVATAVPGKVNMAATAVLLMQVYWLARILHIVKWPKKSRSRKSSNASAVDNDDGYDLRSRKGSNAFTVGNDSRYDLRSRKSSSSMSSSSGSDSDEDRHVLRSRSRKASTVGYDDEDTTITDDTPEKQPLPADATPKRSILASKARQRRASLKESKMCMNCGNEMDV